MLRNERIEPLALTPLIAGQAATLDSFHGDPADRMIYASSLVLQYPPVTKDTQLHAYAESRRDVQVIW